MRNVLHDNVDEKVRDIVTISRASVVEASPATWSPLQGQYRREPEVFLCLCTAMAGEWITYKVFVKQCLW